MNYKIMNYKIKAIFTTENEATTASSLLYAAGYRKEFLGHTQNAHIQQESLVEDHQIEKNHVTVFTPNLNRAFKAKNILTKIGAISTKMKHQFSPNSIKEEKNSVFKNLVSEFQNNLLEHHPQTISLHNPQKNIALKSKKISDPNDIMLTKSQIK